MLKKLMLLAMAVAAMSLAVPALASADILHAETEAAAPNGTEIQVTGQVEFATALGGFHGCGLHAVLKKTAGVWALSGTPVITNAECTGSGGLSNCTVESANAVGTWGVDVGTEAITLTTVKIDGTNNAACGNLVPELGAGALEDIDLSFGSVTLTPTSGSSLGSLSVAGTGVAIVNSAGGLEPSASAGGSLTGNSTWILG